MPRLLFCLILLAIASLQPAAAQQSPLDHIYSADTLVERADEFACQLALSGQVSPDEGFLLASDTYVKKGGGFGIALAVRLRRLDGAQVIDVPVTSFRIEGAGISTAGFAPWELPGGAGAGLVSRDARDVFRTWGRALSSAPFIVTIERGDGRGVLATQMPPLPDDLAERHLSCLERLGG